MKRLVSLLLVLVMALALVACGSSNTAPASSDTAAATDAAPAANEAGEIAVFWYTFGDTYLSSVRAAMEATLKDSGAKYHMYDANGSQTTQTEQIDTAIVQGCGVLVVNIVDASSDDATQAIIDKAKNAGLPLVFFNRSVSEAIVSAYDKAAYVGTDYTMAGHMEGKMVGDYVLANYDAIDLNGDGEISYVMFKGQEGNMEADARTQYGVEDADAVLTAAGKPALKFYDENNSQKYLVDQNGAWSAAQGQDYMQTIMAQFNEASGNAVELVIANNDDMALGAIAALQAQGYNDGQGKTIPVFGVDATDAAKEQIAKGAMTGTIKQDAEGMANAVVIIANNLMAGKDKFDSLDPANKEGEWRINIPYSAYNGE